MSTHWIQHVTSFYTRELWNYFFFLSSVFKGTNFAKRWNFHVCAISECRREFTVEICTESFANGRSTWQGLCILDEHSRWRRWCSLHTVTVVQPLHWSRNILLHLPTSLCLNSFAPTTYSSPFNASRRLSPAHSRLVVWLATGISY